MIYDTGDSGFSTEEAIRIAALLYLAGVCYWLVIVYWHCDNYGSNSWKLNRTILKASVMRKERK